MAKVKSYAHLWLSPTGWESPPPAALTSISAANPALATAAAAIPASVVAGTLVLIEGTSAADVNGAAFQAGTVDGVAKTMELLGADRQGETVATGGTYQPFLTTGATPDLVDTCLANVTVTGVAPDSIAMDDMCGTSTVLGDAKPPTFTFSGFVDNDSAGFRNLVQASIESPKQPRYLLIDYGEDVGYIFGPAEIGEITITAAVNSGLQFSGSGVFTEVPTYSWALAPVTA